VFYVLVKFRGNPEPVLFGTTHISQAARLATMDGAEWASPSIGNGNALEHPTATGGQATAGMLGGRITGYARKVVHARDCGLQGSGLDKKCTCHVEN
jgi:hypothetical protein